MIKEIRDIMPVADSLVVEVDLTGGGLVVESLVAEEVLAVKLELADVELVVESLVAEDVLVVESLGAGDVLVDTLELVDVELVVESLVAGDVLAVESLGAGDVLVVESLVAGDVLVVECLAAGDVLVDKLELADVELVVECLAVEGVLVDKLELADVELVVECLAAEDVLVDKLELADVELVAVPSSVHICVQAGNVVSRVVKEVFVMTCDRVTGESTVSVTVEISFSGNDSSGAAAFGPVVVPGGDCETGNELFCEAARTVQTRVEVAIAVSFVFVKRIVDTSETVTGGSRVSTVGEPDVCARERPVMMAGLDVGHLPLVVGSAVVIVPSEQSQEDVLPLLRVLDRSINFSTVLAFQVIVVSVGEVAKVLEEFLPVLDEAFAWPAVALELPDAEGAENGEWGIELVCTKQRANSSVDWT
ncbi:hypothetical protein EV356DRAFT_578045 [Viridothelium virens]|uniref:Uncharacterized protein n=1 Tax=Viridothelium virens TaxID=1048519 RepID=A0A6A6H4P3_VIRVR|nr:hypothetical protein EV356DRAFT_578045 [Viridothelium virens]